MSLTINSIRFGSGLSPNSAIVVVTVPSGATVTATKNGTILQPKFWTFGNDTTKDAAIFVLSPSYFDAVDPWVFECMFDTEEAVESLFVISNAVYEVEITFESWIIKDGIVAPGITLSRSGGSQSVGTNYIDLSSSASSGTFATLCTSDAIDVRKYNYLICEHQVRGYYENEKCPAYGLIDTVRSGSNPTTFYVAKVLLTATTNNITSKAKTYINIGDYNDLYCIGFQEAGSGNSGASGLFRCYNLYLSNKLPE